MKVSAVTSQPDAAPPAVQRHIVLCSGAPDLSASPALAPFEQRSGGRLGRRLARQGFRGRPGDSIRVDLFGGEEPEELLLWGVGTHPLDPEAWLHLGAALAADCGKHRLDRVSIAPLPPLAPPEDPEPFLRGLLLGRQQDRRYKTMENEALPEAPWKEIVLVDFGQVAAAVSGTSPEAVSLLAEQVRACRELVSTPASDMTPRALGDYAEGLAQRLPLSVKRLDAAACQKLGMGLFLAVARGSQEPPELIHASYEPPAPAGAPAPLCVALVGKGITFDSGGLSLKTASGMKDMKSDMAGGATVLSAVAAAASLELPVTVHAIVPACENMPSGSAYRVGDVLRGMAGPTVEIVNTDAEGRLALADAMAYAQSLTPDILIDVATLTGACVVALGTETAGLFTADDELATAILAAAAQAGESLWRMPLRASLKESLKSALADVKNTGDRWGGAITAALFLQQFAGGTRWAHLDIAGPAFREKGKPGRPVGGTGFGVATLVRLLERLAQPAAAPSAA